ncbi:MAG: GatB/YqeY domain-containing protein [Clostridia bacterium]|nr:GatB/YqeY domain-containing protein [Clostridia bacterium]
MKEELLNELKEAMRNKDELRKDTITLLRSAILQVEKDTQKQLSQDEMLTIVSKEVKKRKESITDYEKAGRQDIIDNLKKEIEILSKYLPEQLTEEEISKLVAEAIVEVRATSPRDMGKVMQSLRPKTNGKADGKLVSQIVKEKLENS